MSTSPHSAFSQSLLDWDEGAVNTFVVSVLGADKYGGVVHEHGITGDVLVAMDHESLSDMGMASLGHRLKLLRAVWEVKRDQGMELSLDDWQPQDVPELGPERMEAERLLETVTELQERVLNLERDHVRMLNALDEYGISVPLASSSDGDLVPPPATLGNTAGYIPAPPAISRTKQPPSQIYAPSHTSSAQAHVAPRSSESATFGPSLTPTTSMSNAAAMATAQQYSFDSPSQLVPRDEGAQGVQAHTRGGSVGQGRPALPPPPFKRMMSGNSMVAAGAQNQATLYGSGSAGAPSALAASSITASPVETSSSSRTARPHGLAPDQASLAASASSTLVESQSSNRGAEAVSTAENSVSASASASAKESANRAAKSFRVTLEDPCWKVLPAALKKYKINDDWKLYALFICFGNTERCLSYDEKPLMLFQKLKEGGQKPVFMLRHIKDIKSPIAVAQQKQAVKMGLPATTTQNVLPKIKATGDKSSSPIKSDSLAPSLGSRDGGSGLPDMSSPSPRDGVSTSDRSGISGAGSGSGAEVGTVLDVNGNVQHVTYAVAIYPYIADRQDEFDVAVGATFVIMNKAKGWYVVQKDPEGLGDVISESSKTGWVPAGCLLELSSPISLVSPSIAPGESLPAYPGLAALPPTAILSSSYPGIVLMDYTAKAETELSIKDGERVKVYKKYTHWSYTIKIETGDRGWVPGWFIGKLASSTPGAPSSAGLLPTSGGLGGSTSGGGGSGQESTPSTATLTALPRSAVPNPNGSVDSVGAATTPVSGGSAGSAVHAPAPGGGEEGEAIDFGNGSGSGNGNG